MCPSEGSVDPCETQSGWPTQLTWDTFTDMSESETARHTPSRSDTPTVLSYLPGVMAGAAVAASASLLAGALPAGVSPIPVALILGVIVGNVLSHRYLRDGLRILTSHVLRIGIVLLGARLSLGDVARLGSESIVLVATSITLGFGVAWIVGQRLSCGRQLAALIGVGSAICGNTAIMATAPVIKARSSDVALAVSTVTICGTVSLLILPPIGRLSGMGDVSFGLWAGLAIQDTSQVVAAGTAFSESARDVATVVKLIRNAAMALVIPAVAWRVGGEHARGDGLRSSVRNAIPTFLLAFFGMMALRTFGVISEPIAGVLTGFADLAILVAIVGVGMSLVIGELTRASWRALATGAAAALTLAVVGYMLVSLLTPSVG